MKKNIFLLLIAILATCFNIFISNSVMAESNDFDAMLFYGQGCPHCSSMKAFLSEMEEKYPDFEYASYEVYFQKENSELFQKTASLYDKEARGVPTLFIGEDVFVGFSANMKKELEEKISYCAENGCVLKNHRKADEEDVFAKKISISAVIGGSLVDAINPCAFAVLIILISTILASGSRRRALFSGIAFSIAIFISYYLMGVGLYSAVAVVGVSRTFYIIVAILAILLGLFNLKDYLWYGKWFVMEVPMSWRPKLKSIIKGVTSIPGAFLIGFVVSLFLLPCTSGPYIVILGLLSQTATYHQALALLLLYNFIFILPMILITLAVYSGITSAEKAEKWRKCRLETLHLIAGGILLLLGAVMLISLYFGYL